MIHDIVSAEYISGYLVLICFDNTKSGIVDFSEYVSRGGVFSKWEDINEFKKFRIDMDSGNIVWNGDVDIAPETLYAKATGDILPEWMEQV